MGAHFRLAIHNCSWDEIISRIEISGLHAYLAATDDGEPYHKLDFREPIAIILGGEAEGAGETAQQAAESHFHIPMPGGGESLNASVAAGIVLFEVIRQRVMSL
jgi:TrmH family RNA methyltransferase